jgi:hypothetical protein
VKVRNGVNPDYADYDEMDQDALDAIEEYDQGYLTYDELRAQIGPEAAAELRDRFRETDPYFGDLLDDPEDF